MSKFVTTWPPTVRRLASKEAGSYLNFGEMILGFGEFMSFRE